jgi:tryptophan synthase alpha chain
MQNKIDDCFARLRAAHGKAFIPYICAGDPTLSKTVDLVRGLESAGADLIELGIPFSDPLADGIVNQLAAQRALDAGATVPGVLDCVGKIRAGSNIPIVLYSYLNPIVQFGFEKFHTAAQKAGVDGLLILDLPPEEELQASPRLSSDPDRAAASNVLHIRLVAPTTPIDRIKQIAATAKGFLYYVSREGVTGAQKSIASSLAERVGELKRCSNLPVAVGFGISTPQQAAEIARIADGVVVGSAIVDLIAKHGTESDGIKKVCSFARDLAAAVHTAEALEA